MRHNDGRFENVNFLPMKIDKTKNLFLQTVCYALVVFSRLTNLN